jgi:hypothetical protein
MEVFFFLIVIGVLAYGAFMIWIMVCRPEQYQAMVQRKHEERMAKLAQEEAKRKEAAGGLLAGLAKAAIEAAMRGRGHH